MEQDLREMTTFGVPAQAPMFIKAQSRDEIYGGTEAILSTGLPLFPLGGGSNILFVQSPKAGVLQVATKGIYIQDESPSEVRVRAESGEVWHSLVEWAVERGYGGIENMALIPGTVGAAPIQNIGAYGVELAEVIESVEYWDCASHTLRTLQRDECRFGYRNSIFKTWERGRFVITSITMRLTTANHRLKSDYADVGVRAKALAEGSITPRDIFKAVCEIRREKLPDPAVVGNAGSFFKNPVVEADLAETLKRQYPEMPVWPASHGAKIPAGWLIEKAGWKGYRSGAVGVHHKQALVLVHYGGGQGRDVWELAHKVMQSVSSLFGISLEPEVNIIGRDD